MSGKITIEISQSFIDWWRTLAQHIQDDQTIMLIAWAAWEESKKLAEKEVN